jgi:hypothetical protein
LSSICFHFRKCDDPQTCKGCHSGPPKCPAIIEPTQPTKPEDCSALEDNPPPHGTLVSHSSPPPKLLLRNAMQPARGGESATCLVILVTPPLVHQWFPA